jgi:hypothetical protein
MIPWLLTIAGAVWTTGNSVLLLTAFSAFHWANRDLLSRDAAGAVFGTTLERWSSLVAIPLIVVLFSLGWLAGGAWKARRIGWATTWAMALGLLWAVHALNHQTTVQANQVHAGIVELKAKPQTDQGPLPALEQRFAALHHASERWHGVETLLALGVTVGAATVLLRRLRRAEQASHAAAAAAQAGAGTAAGPT